VFDKVELKLLWGKLRGKKRIAAYALLKKDDKFLLVQEGSGRIQGLWGLPGGGVKDGETHEETVIREAKEESGYEVSVIKKVGNYRDKKRASIRIVYMSGILGGKLSVDNDEIVRADWFSKDQIVDMKGVLRGDWVIRSINDSEKI
jgi:ADP-ribose pyrophosphatase YjhB (NUDIX family)